MTAAQKLPVTFLQDYISKPLDRKPLNDILSKWIPGSYKKMRNSKAEDSTEIQIRFEDIRIPGIDIQEAKKHHTGDVEDFLELLQLYCMDGKRKCTLLRELIQNEDYTNYGIEVHGLKSASANVGAMELSAQAREHEEAANRKDAEFINRHFGDLMFCYGEQIKSIEHFLNNRENLVNDNSAEESMSIDTQALLRETEEALDKLENFHSKDCARIVDELLKYQLDYYTEDKLKEIREQLRLYEDDEAERLRHSLIDWLKKEDLK